MFAYPVINECVFHRSRFLLSSFSTRFLRHPHHISRRIVVLVWICFLAGKFCRPQDHLWLVEIEFSCKISLAAKIKIQPTERRDLNNIIKFWEIKRECWWINRCVWAEMVQTCERNQELIWCSMIVNWCDWIVWKNILKRKWRRKSQNVDDVRQNLQF